MVPRPLDRAGSRSVDDGFPRVLGSQVGGRLRGFLPAWEKITNDAFVLSVVREGFYIDIVEPLPNGVLRSRSPTMSPLFQEHISAEIVSLLEKGAIEEVRDHPRLCLSPVFVIPKRSGSLRMILNMKRINLHLDKTHFRMDHLASILPSLDPVDVAISLDLRDAYFHIPIHQRSRDLLGFAFLGKVYRYRALPFGLRPAPRIFTRIVATVMAHLRRRGLRLFAYLDDWLLVAKSEVLLLDHLQILISTTQDLGFLINWEKSEFVPTRTPSYLGAQLDIRQQLARPSLDRVKTIVATARSLRGSRRVRAERWLQWLGYLSSLVDVLPDCRLLMRPFQLHLLEFYRPGVSSPSMWIPLPAKIKALLIVWLRRSFLLQGKPFSVPLPTVTVTTDASLVGWGGHCQGSMISGDWNHLDVLPHINVLELMGVFASLRHFRARLVGRSVLILTDNVSVMAYINRQGGTHSLALNDLASRLWAWCNAARIFPIASHIPGEENLIADFLSRGKCLPSEWMLSPIVFRQIMSVFGVLDIDLFATSLNHRLPRFYSRVRDPGAFARDAFAFPWGGEGLMLFPRSR